MTSFEEALRPHYNDALRYCTAICSDWSADEAEDVLQQSLLNAFEHFEELRDPDRFKSWLFTIIRRTFLRATRRHFWRRFIPLPGPDREELQPVLAPLRDSEEVRKLLRCLSALSSRERATLLLHEIGGFTVEEIAPMVGDTTSSSVKSRLSRSRRKLLRAVARVTISRQRRGRPGPEASGGDIENETIRIVEEVTKPGRSGR